LKYRRLANDLLEILRSDSITAFLAHDRYLAIGTAKGHIILTDHEGNKIQDISSHSGRINCLKIDRKAELIASCSEDGQGNGF
jgi:WD40 repeat protein